MRIVEEFTSIQGEGKFVGTPSYFIRTTGCNLRCSWENKDGTKTKCDTPYTSFQPERGYELNLEKTLDAIKEAEVKDVIVTGGEPTLYKDLQKVVQRLVQEQYNVTVETNATRYISGINTAFISASPKLKSSYALESNSLLQMHARNNNFKSVVRQWMASNPYQVKFVINEEQDIVEVLALQEELCIPKENMYLMPQGANVEIVKERGKMVVGLCVEYGFHFTPRLHIELFGDKRGT